MRVLIAGAAGSMRQALVRAASKKQYIITAVSQGDLLQAGALDRAMAAQEAVICALEVKRTRQPVREFSEGTENLIRAMQRHNVRRLLCITGVGAGTSRGHGGFWFDRAIQPFFLNTIYEDKDRQERLVAACDRDWSIIRPAQLTDGRARARFSVVRNVRGLRANRISRADVAEWTVTQLKTGQNLYRAMALTE